MTSLSPKYRVLLNKNLLKYPNFIYFLKHEYNSLINKTIKQSHADLEQEYKFTIGSIPVQWGNYIIPKLRVNDSLPDDKKDKDLTKLSEILISLDPMNPIPVDVSFKLSEIITFVNDEIKHYQEVAPGGVRDYFGIETQLWFKNYPIQTGTVLRAVDFGTQDNFPLHLFDSAFTMIRINLLDLFVFFVNNYNMEEENKVVVKNVDI